MPDVHTPMFRDIANFVQEAWTRNENEANSRFKRTMSPIGQSKQLFLSYLSPHQRRTFKSGNYIQVKGNVTHRYYHMECHVAIMNIWHEHICYCAMTIPVNRSMLTHRRYVPTYDTLLVQKLTIENDENTFLKAARRYSDFWGD